MTTLTPAPGGLGQRVRSGLMWSTLSSVLLRMGSLVVGIVLARLLAPEDFGVYAVALTVQSIFMTLADLGLSADLIRSADHEWKAPSVATVGVVCGALLTAVMALAAPWLASGLGSPDSASTIALLGLTIVLAGAGVVPYAALSRAFAQRRLLLLSAVDFAVGTTLTLWLVASGMGVVSLAVGRVAAATVALVLLFHLAGVRPRYGFDPAAVREALRFGVPVALANLLSWALLSIDTVVIARELGPTMLGFYVLAFNVSSWPMSTLGQAVRAVALPGFAQGHGPVEGPDPTLARAAALAWAAAVPAGALLAVLSVPVIGLLYGATWAPAAPVLAALAAFGSTRVVFDLCAAYLLAKGAAGPTLVVQVVWFVALVPAVWWGATSYGLAGAAWAHVVVSAVVVLPAYLVASGRVGAHVPAVLKVLWPPLVAVVPAALAAWFASGLVVGSFVQLALGGTAGAVVYLIAIRSWIAPYVPAREARP